MISCVSSYSRRESPNSQQECVQRPNTRRSWQNWPSLSKRKMKGSERAPSCLRRGCSAPLNKMGKTIRHFRTKFRVSDVRFVTVGNLFDLIVAETDMQERGQLDCGHRYCFQCIADWSKVTNLCPLCKRAFLKISKTVAKSDKVEEILVESKAVDLDELLQEPDLQNGRAHLTFS